VDPKGYILTNNHVVAGATKIMVSLPGGDEYSAKVIGTDPQTDVAVIKINRTQAFTSAQIGNAKDMKVGDWVLAIGSPFGLEQTVTAGIISPQGAFSTMYRPHHLGATICKRMRLLIPATAVARSSI